MAHVSFHTVYRDVALSLVIPRELYISHIPSFRGVPEEDTPNAVHSNPAWHNGCVYQGGMDVNTFQHINALSYDNLGPTPTLALSPYGTDSGSLPQRVARKFNPSEQDSTTRLNTNELVLWRPVKRFQDTVAPSQGNKRQRIGGPVHSVFDSGYATSATATIVSPFSVDQAVYPPAVDPSWNTPRGYLPLQNQFAVGSEQEQQQQQQQQASWQGSIEVRSQVNDPPFACDEPDCGWTGKCQSELT
ncbi:hypothetical protein ACJ73_09072 [Blastomyces percursus]|uniref:Uncharacterized protein n=1 Tax=Blastomyces percursus TaxID=1658174 RepID=A0A1J9QH78_9EURO|nr:hypothetical protein ACJ73_09072 [Blastomyces percursus]